MSVSMPSESRLSDGSKANFIDDGEESKELSFVVKPRSQSTPLGEVAKFVCAVQGQSPIGKTTPNRTIVYCLLSVLEVDICYET